MSVFSSSISHRSFYWQISVLCFVLGLLLAAAWHTSSQISRAGGLSVRQTFFAGAVPETARKKTAEYESEIKKKNDYITELEALVASGKSSTSTLNEELQKTKFLAGLTEADGPGIQITLTDSRKQPVDAMQQLRQSHLIHDYDLGNVVNELKAAGAEAIMVSGQRIVGSSPIRCVGPVIHVNNVPATPPIVIQAIGDPDTLLGAMNLQGGVKDQFYDPEMMKVEKKTSLHLPAFTGGTQMKYAHQPQTPAGDTESKESVDKESKGKQE